MFKNLLALLLGLFLSLIFFVTIEIVLTLGEKDYAQRPINIQKHLAQLFSLPKEAYLRDYNIHHDQPIITNVIDTTVGTKYTVTTDKYSRRITHDIKSQEPKRSQYAVFFGCSLIFGDGISDDETLPYIFERDNSQYQSYNYALPGSAPNIFLYFLSQRNLSQELDQSSGNVFYFYQTGHIQRANHHISIMSFSWPTPRYKWNDQNMLELDTSFSLKNEITSFFSRSYLFRRGIKLFNPFAYSEDQFNKTCQMIYQIGLEVNKQLPKSNFITVLYPGESDSRMGECLKSKNVSVIDFSGIKRDPKLRTHWDGGHPSKEENQVYSLLLLEALSNLKKN